MSAHVLEHQIRPLRIPSGGGRIATGGCHVAVSTIVNADRARIFQALTVAEYMEAWLCFPGSAETSASVSRDGSGYRIERRGSEACICGAWLTMRRGRLLFTWQCGGRETSPESLVLIRLYGEFARTRVCLHHVGLDSAKERAWHLELWTASLNKLSALFGRD